MGILILFASFLLKIFNILGPLTNPACPETSVIGVSSHHLGDLVIQSLKIEGMKKAMVVCGMEGLDEVLSMLFFLPSLLSPFQNFKINLILFSLLFFFFSFNPDQPGETYLCNIEISSQFYHPIFS